MTLIHALALGLGIGIVNALCLTFVLFVVRSDARTNQRKKHKETLELLAQRIELDKKKVAHLERISVHLADVAEQLEEHMDGLRARESP